MTISLSSNLADILPECLQIGVLVVLEFALDRFELAGDTVQILFAFGLAAQLVDRPLRLRLDLDVLVLHELDEPVVLVVRQREPVDRPLLRGGA